MESFADRFIHDRRVARRHHVRTALRVRVWKSNIPERRAESLNLSERGIYFAIDSGLCKGEAVKILLKMPEEITGEPTTEWRCTGRVLRVEPLDEPAGKLGVGVRFDCYEIARAPRARQMETTVLRLDGRRP